MRECPLCPSIKKYVEAWDTHDPEKEFQNLNLFPEGNMTFVELGLISYKKDPIKDRGFSHRGGPSESNVQTHYLCLRYLQCGEGDSCKDRVGGLPFCEKVAVYWSVGPLDHLESLKF